MDYFKTTEKADFVNLTEKSTYITFGCVLLIWELIPAFVIIFLFRIRSMNDSTNLNEFASLSTSYVTPKKPGFFSSCLNRFKQPTSQEKDVLFGQSTSSTNMNYYNTINSYKSVFVDISETGSIDN